MPANKLKNKIQKLLRSLEKHVFQVSQGSIATDWLSYWGCRRQFELYFLNTLKLLLVVHTLVTPTLEKSKRMSLEWAPIISKKNCCGDGDVGCWKPSLRNVGFPVLTCFLLIRGPPSLYYGVMVWYLNMRPFKRLYMCALFFGGLFYWVY